MNKSLGTNKVLENLPLPDTISIWKGDTGHALSLGLSVSKAVSEAPAGQVLNSSFSLGYCCHPPLVPHWEEMQEQG